MLELVGIRSTSYDDADDESDGIGGHNRDPTTKNTSQTSSPTTKTPLPSVKSSRRSHTDNDQPRELVDSNALLALLQKSDLYKLEGVESPLKSQRKTPATTESKTNKSPRRERSTSPRPPRPSIAQVPPQKRVSRRELQEKSNSLRSLRSSAAGPPRRSNVAIAGRGIASMNLSNASPSGSFRRRTMSPQRPPKSPTRPPASAASPRRRTMSPLRPSIGDMEPHRRISRSDLEVQRSPRSPASRRPRRSNVAITARSSATSDDTADLRPPPLLAGAEETLSPKKTEDATSTHDSTPRSPHRKCESRGSRNSATSPPRRTSRPQRASGTISPVSPKSHSVTSQKDES